MPRNLKRYANHEEYLYYFFKGSKDFLCIKSFFFWRLFFFFVSWLFCYFSLIFNSTIDLNLFWKIFCRPLICLISCVFKICPSITQFDHARDGKIGILYTSITIIYITISGKWWRFIAFCLLILQWTS